MNELKGMIRRWYYDNKEKIWKFIIMAIVVIAIIQIANNYYKNKSNTSTNTTYTTGSSTTSINNNITGTLESSKSLISGNSVSGTKLETEIDVIDTFIDYCNTGKSESAYELLTDECKEEVFPSLESFEKKYLANVFDTTKTYSVQNWFSSTYKVKITEDALTTGKVNSAELQEYITVVEKNSEYKLNINNYVGRTTINKSNTINGVKITVISKDTYMDYETYDIKVQNLSENTIWLDNGNQTNTIYVEDDNNMKSYVYTGEIIYENFKLISGETRSYTLKFSNSYSSSRNLKYLVFKNVILNYEEYKNSKSYSDYEMVSVNI